MTCVIFVCFEKETRVIFACILQFEDPTLRKKKINLEEITCVIVVCFEKETCQSSNLRIQLLYYTSYIPVLVLFMVSSI